MPVPQSMVNAVGKLFIVKRSRFARGPADHKALDSGRGKRASQRGEATVVNFATAKRRDQENPQAGEFSLRGSGHDVSFREVWTESSAVERQALQKDLGYSCSVASLTTEPGHRSGQVSGDLALMFASWHAWATCLGRKDVSITDCMP